VLAKIWILVSVTNSVCTLCFQLSHLIFGSLVYILRIRSCPLQKCSLVRWRDMLLPSGGILHNNNNNNNNNNSPLTQKTPPFQAQHWNIRLAIRGSLRSSRTERGETRRGQTSPGKGQRLPSRPRHPPSWAWTPWKRHRIVAGWERPLRSSSCR